MKILIFGGTGEARELANQLVGLGYNVTSSLAGRTHNPLLPKGEIRYGGFGDVQNLMQFLGTQKFDWLIDATHPYAALMSHKLSSVAQDKQISFLRVMRPVWTAPDGAEWHEVDDVAKAFSVLPSAARPFVSLGHKDMHKITHWPTMGCVVRLIEPPTIALSTTVDLVLSRPPYDVDGEIALMRSHNITHLITKNSGGAQTRAKIDAAATLGLPIIALKRPTLPIAPETPNVESAIERIQASVPED